MKDLTDNQIAMMFLTSTLREFMDDQDYEEYSPLLIASFQALGVSFEEVYAVNYLKEDIETDNEDTMDTLNKLYREGLQRILEKSKANIAEFMRNAHKKKTQENLN